MTRDDVLEMARRAGVKFDTHCGLAYNCGTETFVRFAALVAERTREECANVCCIQMDGEECAEAIRSMKAY